MKKLSLILLFSTSLLASECPELAGAYHCTLSDNSYSLLEIQQKALSSELMEYSFNYVAIPGDPDIFNASSSGESDNVGWINYCLETKLVSIPQDGSARSEIFLNEEKALVRTLNGVIQQVCPRKNET